MNASVKLLESVVPATVALNVEVREHHPSAKILGKQRHGTGTVIDGDGLILTVNYIVLGARTISAVLADGTSHPARLIARDLQSGLAVLAIEASSLPALPLASSKQLRLGQEMFIVAAADSPPRRASEGCITSLQPFDAYWEFAVEPAIVSSAVNPGLGGGPMIDCAGRVIGITALDLNEVGRFTLAIPPDEFLLHRDDLLQHGCRTDAPRRAWIGFYCYTFREHVVIAGVMPDSPGARAGLVAGDVVLALDGNEIGDRRQLYQQLWRKCSGDRIELRLFRDNEVLHLVIAAGDAEEFFA